MTMSRVRRHFCNAVDIFSTLPSVPVINSMLGQKQSGEESVCLIDKEERQDRNLKAGTRVKAQSTHRFSPASFRSRSAAFPAQPRPGEAIRLEGKRNGKNFSVEVPSFLVCHADH